MKYGIKALSLTALLGAAAFVASCESAEVKAERLAAEKAALAVCPAEQTVALDAYTLDLPALEGSAQKFHTDLAVRDNVVTLPSGLQYSVVQSGNEAAPSPAPENVVKVNYHGVFPNGEVFDSSYERQDAAEFPLNRVIPGWTEGVGLMRPCDAWTFYIPSDLAYGPRGRPGIPGGASLVFHVQLLEVK
jgi:FKBP-type peptidyl-prolyl cis-trans isomerase